MKAEPVTLTAEAAAEIKCLIAGFMERRDSGCTGLCLAGKCPEGFKHSYDYCPYCKAARIRELLGVKP